MNGRRKKIHFLGFIWSYFFLKKYFLLFNFNTVFKNNFFFKYGQMDLYFKKKLVKIIFTYYLKIVLHFTLFLKKKIHITIIK